MTMRTPADCSTEELGKYELRAGRNVRFLIAIDASGSASFVIESTHPEGGRPYRTTIGAHHIGALRTALDLWAKRAAAIRDPHRDAHRAQERVEAQRLRPPGTPRGKTSP